MFSPGHSAINAKSVKIKAKIDLIPKDGQVVVFQNSDLQTLFAKGELPFFQELNKKEQMYVIQTPIIELQNQLALSEERNVDCSLIFTNKDEVQVLYPKTRALVFCVLQSNGAIKINHPSRSVLHDFKEMNISSCKLIQSMIDETFLILVEADRAKDHYLIEKEIISKFQLFQTKYMTSEDQESLKNSPLMTITKVTRANLANWMIIFDENVRSSLSGGLCALYKDSLNRHALFAIHSRQIVGHIEAFLSDFWNLSIFATSARADINFIHTLSASTVKICDNEHRLPSAIVKILKCLRYNKKDKTTHDSHVAILNKIKLIVSKEIPSISKSLRIDLSTIDTLDNMIKTLASISDPQKCFYATLYFSLTKIGTFNFDFRIFEDIFFNEQMKEIFKFDKYPNQVFVDADKSLRT